MQKMKWFNGLALILVFMLAFALTGCANGGNNNAPSAAPSATATPAPEEPAGTEEPEAIDLGGATVRIGAWYEADPRVTPEADRSLLAQMQVELIEAAEEKYNANIEFVTLDYSQMVEQFTTTSLAGEPFADIVRLELFWMFPKLVNDGFVAELDSLIEIDPEKMPQWMLQGGSMDGKQYGLVESSPSGFGVWYNKTMFQNLGLEDPYELQQKGEWTWDKFIEIAKAATKDTNGDGQIDVFGFSGNPKEVYHQFIYSNNASVDVAEDGSAKFSLESPNAMEASQAFYDMYNTHKVVDMSGEDHNQQFIKGNVAMVTAFTWEIDNYKANMTDELGFVFWPKGPKADKYAAFTPFGNMWAIAKQSKHAEAAAKIMDDITIWRPLYPEVQALLEESREATFPSKEIIDTVVQMGQNVEYISYYAYPSAEEILEGAINNMKDGKETPATAIEKIKPQFESAISQIVK